MNTETLGAEWGSIIVIQDYTKSFKAKGEAIVSLMESLTREMNECVKRENLDLGNFEVRIGCFPVEAFYDFKGYWALIPMKKENEEK